MGRYLWLLLLELGLIATGGFLLFRTGVSSPTSSPPSYSQEIVRQPVSYVEKAVLGEAVTKTSVLTPTTTHPSIWPTPTQAPSKSQYRIMLYGDSMIETMGSSATALRESLRTRYPQTEFMIVNYARGAQNVEVAYQRAQELLPNLVVPDIIIVGSYAYNPFAPHSVPKHTEYLTKLLERFTEKGSAVYLLAEIAPAKNLFGARAPGLNWDDTWRYAQSTNVIALLENALKVATRMNIRIIDAYHDSIVNTDKSGDLRYINTDDYLHPSTLGHQFMADKIVSVLDLN